MSRKTVPIFFAVDDNYAPYLAVCINSIIKNCDKNRKYEIKILNDKVNEKNKCAIADLATTNVSIEFFTIEKGLEAITDDISNRLRFDQFTLTIYYRLFIPTIFKEYDKAIYIDCDVIINTDLGKLFDIEIGDNYIGACNDLSVADVPVLVDYMENVVGVKGSKYINSGVLLMNLEKLRESNLDKHFLSLLQEYHFDSVAPDQDYINALCEGKIYYLDSHWNTMPNENKPPIQNPYLIHYNLYSKPWCGYSQYADYFWNYAKESVFYEEILNFKNMYTEELRKADKEKMKVLINRAANILKNEITFRKIEEKGVRIKL